MVSKVVKFCLNIIIAVNIQTTLTCPSEGSRKFSDGLVDAKAAYKSGRSELADVGGPITLERIKMKLKEAKIFNPDDKTLTYRDKKELTKLFNAVEIMTTSRSRQPSSAQNMFSSLRLVERAMKKQLKEGQISESLAAKFNWENLPRRTKRDKATFKVNRKTNMRIFDVTS